MMCLCVCVCPTVMYIPLQKNLRDALRVLAYVRGKLANVRELMLQFHSQVEVHYKYS